MSGNDDNCIITGNDQYCVVKASYIGLPHKGIVDSFTRSVNMMCDKTFVPIGNVNVIQNGQNVTIMQALIRDPNNKVVYQLVHHESMSASPELRKYNETHFTADISMYIGAGYGLLGNLVTVPFDGHIIMSQALIRKIVSKFVVVKDY